MSASPPPCTVIGRPSSDEKANDAPICVSGRAIRRIGRRLRLASPMNVALNGCPATIPAINRVVVPLLPQSSSAPGDVRPRRPSPVIRNVASALHCDGTETPSADSTPAVLITSADGNTPRSTLSPVASAANLSARCDSDLSPGTATLRTPLTAATLRASWQDPSCHRGISRSPASAD